MRIAVTTENGQVFGHFGKCKSFTLFEVEDGKIVNKSMIDPMGAGHGALAGVLGDHQVNVLICGGLGQGARDALAARGIKVESGVTGSVDLAVQDYLAGRLISNPNFVCNHHHHDHAEGHDCHCHD